MMKRFHILVRVLSIKIKNNKIPSLLNMHSTVDSLRVNNCTISNKVPPNKLHKRKTLYDTITQFESKNKTSTCRNSTL